MGITDPHSTALRVATSSEAWRWSCAGRGRRVPIRSGSPSCHHGNRPPLHLSFRPEAEGRSGEIWRRIRYASPMQADVSTTLDMTRGCARRGERLGSTQREAHSCRRASRNRLGPFGESSIAFRGEDLPQETDERLRFEVAFPEADTYGLGIRDADFALEVGEERLGRGEGIPRSSRGQAPSL